MTNTQRAPHNASRPYTLITNALLQDKGLSYEARGLLAELLSRPDDWKVMPSQLQLPNAGKDKVYRILNELIEAGYIQRTMVRGKDGRAAHWEYRVFEDKQGVETPGTAMSPDGKVADLPFLAKPDVDNPPLQKKEKEQIQKIPELRSDAVKTDTDTPSKPKRKKATTPKNPTPHSAAPPSPRKPDEVFDAVREVVFGLAQPNGSAPRIGMAAKAIRSIQPDATAADVRAFVDWYQRKYPDVAVPRDDGKITEHYAMFHQKRIAAPVRVAVPVYVEQPVIVLTAEEIAERKAAMAEVRREIAAGK